ncbi:SGNH/GDSL hydrolase family protein [Gandjariella thermophila]|uniref:SGNH/GDSL hydrolase family protein n=1 Tax=Gandjariella thermophila TaxID=1931992 RepID=UPI00186422C4|nr:SGNH/GDSL hydrolase family protein [Gandjariella thermophila]
MRRLSGPAGDLADLLRVLAASWPGRMLTGHHLPALQRMPDRYLPLLADEASRAGRIAAPRDAAALVRRALRRWPPSGVPRWPRRVPSLGGVRLVPPRRAWTNATPMIVAVAALGGTALTSPASASSTAPRSPLTWCRDKSSMAVIGDSGSTGYGVVDPKNAWVAALRRAKPHTRIVNYAHDGAMVSDFLPGGRWPQTTGAVRDIGRRQPSLVLIEIGGNDYYMDRDPARYQADLDRLTRAIWSVSPRSTLVYETIWPFDPRHSPTAVHSWDEYAAAMHRLVVKYHAGWIDLRQFFPPNYSADADTHLLNPDRIHPTDAGNAVEFAAVLNILNRC